jgi:DNA-binding transcriptional regulator YdaS (Cro superfamily)
MKVVNQASFDRLGLNRNPDGTPNQCKTVKQWQRKARAVLATRGDAIERNKNPINLWVLILEAQEVRVLSSDECVQDGYVVGTAMHIINGKHVLTVGQAVPQTTEGGSTPSAEASAESHYCSFVAEYTDAGQASAADLSDGTAGMTAAIPINDACSLIYSAMGKTVRKMLMTRALLDQSLSGHLSLYADACEHLDKATECITKAENATDCYKLMFDWAETYATRVFRGAMQAKEAGELCLQLTQQSSPAAPAPAPAIGLARYDIPATPHHIPDGKGGKGPPPNEAKAQQLQRPRPLDRHTKPAENPFAEGYRRT